MKKEQSEIFDPQWLKSYGDSPKVSANTTEYLSEVIFSVPRQTQQYEQRYVVPIFVASGDNRNTDITQQEDKTYRIYNMLAASTRRHLRRSCLVNTSGVLPECDRETSYRCGSIWTSIWGLTITRCVSVSYLKKRVSFCLINSHFLGRKCSIYHWSTSTKLGLAFPAFPADLLRLKSIESN